MQQDKSQSIIGRGFISFIRPASVSLGTESPTAAGLSIASIKRFAPIPRAIDISSPIRSPAGLGLGLGYTPKVESNALTKLVEYKHTIFADATNPQDRFIVYKPHDGKVTSKLPGNGGLTRDHCVAIGGDLVTTSLHPESKDPSPIDPVACDMKLYDSVQALKKGLDHVPELLFLMARFMTNPFELIQRLGFQNRAAVKMMELMCVLRQMALKPGYDAKYEPALGRACSDLDAETRGQLWVDLKDLAPIMYADICAGPGGFSEFLQFVYECRAKGFGFTLRGSDDFRPDRFRSPTDTWKPYYGPRQTGDITDPANLRGFLEFIQLHTHGQMLDLVIGDGGFSVEGEECIQEQLSAQILICQCAVGIAATRPGDTHAMFVTKTFDVVTRLSLEIVAALKLCFENVSFCFLDQSRPANSERYLVCIGRRSNAEMARQWQQFHQLPLCSSSWGPVFEALMAMNRNIRMHIHERTSLHGTLARLPDSAHRQANKRVALEDIGATSSLFPGIALAKSSLGVSVRECNDKYLQSQRAYLLSIHQLLATWTGDDSWRKKLDVCLRSTTWINRESAQQQIARMRKNSRSPLTSVEELVLNLNYVTDIPLLINLLNMSYSFTVLDDAKRKLMNASDIADDCVSKWKWKNDDGACKYRLCDHTGADSASDGLMLSEFCRGILNNWNKTNCLVLEHDSPIEFLSAAAAAAKAPTIMYQDSMAVSPVRLGDIQAGILITTCRQQFWCGVPFGPSWKLKPELVWPEHQRYLVPADTILYGLRSVSTASFRVLQAIHVSTAGSDASLIQIIMRNIWDERVVCAHLEPECSAVATKRLVIITTAIVDTGLTYWHWCC